MNTMSGSFISYFKAIRSKILFLEHFIFYRAFVIFLRCIFGQYVSFAITISIPVYIFTVRWQQSF